MTAPVLIRSDQLKAWLDIKQDAALIRWLEQNGIPYKFAGKNKPVTTLTQIDKALARTGGLKVDDVEFL